jgi:hypothetical protein
MSRTIAGYLYKYMYRILGKPKLLAWRSKTRPGLNFVDMARNFEPEGVKGPF